MSDPVAAEDPPRASVLACVECRRANPPESRFCAGCGARLDAPGEWEAERPGHADPLVGRVIAERYRIDELVGRGGMGVVYRVEHVRIGKAMAMKLLHGELARQNDVIKRFRREAEAASKLDHPSTVQVFDFGRSDGLTYLVMELLGGQDLNHLIQVEGALEFARVARIAAQIAGSVSQAHERGIVHRDLKPENVRVLAGEGGTDRVKVMDFGLAKLRESEELKGASITRAGFIVGTPYYMAPEHIRGESVDARSDVYALGALVYKCVTGVPPFWAPTPVGVLTKHLTEPVVPPSVRSSRRDVPALCDEIVMRAMAKDPAERFQSMRELREELLAFLRSQGEDTAPFGSARMTLPAPDAVAVSDSGRKVEVATRGDVDRYERGIRVQQGALYGLLVVVAAALVVGAYFAWVRFGPSPRAPTSASASEVEPNDVPADAMPLPEGRLVTAYLGRRIDTSRSDADVYRIDTGTREPTVISLEVGGLPNVDMVVDVFRGSAAEPLFTIDGVVQGHAEIVPNLPLTERLYFVRVRELWQSGRYPTENVSDAYTIRWRPVAVEEGDEREINDRFELAERIAIGESRRGFVGWDGDHDWFCAASDAALAHATLSGTSRLDLVLAVHEGTGPSRRFDVGRVGASETTGPLVIAAGRTCFVVSAAPGNIRADGETRYTLTLSEGDADAP